MSGDLFENDNYSVFTQRNTSLHRLVTNISNKNETVPPYGATYDNLTPKGIACAVDNGDISADKYVLLYLYENKPGDVSREFLETYGAGLNNRLNIGIPMFTVYPKETFEKWKPQLFDNVTNVLTEQFKESKNSTSRYILMYDLAKEYHVEHDLPALVVIDTKKTDGYSERFTVCGFKDCVTPREIYRKLSEVLDTIQNTPNDFEAITEVCSGKLGYRNKNLSDFYEKHDPMSFRNIVERHLKEENKTKTVISEQLGWHRNSLANYLSMKSRIKLDRLFALALRLHFTVDELSYLIYNYSNATQLQINNWKNRNDDRYNAILECLKTGMDEQETNDYLENRNLARLEYLDKAKEKESKSSKNA